MTIARQRRFEDRRSPRFHLRWRMRGAHDPTRLGSGHRWYGGEP